MAASVTVDFNAQVTRFVSGVDRMTNDLNKFQSHTQRVSRNINSILGTLGVGLSVAGLVAFAKSSIDAADKLNDLSKTTNLTVTQLTGLQLAAKQTGSDLDGIAASVAKLSVNMGKDPDRFRKLGVDARDPIQALQQLSDVLIGIEDPHKRSAVAAAALGKSWQTAAPLLALGSTEIGRLVAEGQRLSPHMEEMAKQANEFNDRLDKLSIASSNASASILVNLLPAVTKAIEQFTEGKKIAGGFIEAILLFGTINPFKTTGESVKGLRQEIESLQAARGRYEKSNSDTRSIDMAIATLQKKYEFAKYLQREEALALGKGFGDYKVAKPISVGTDPSKFLGDDSASKASAARKKAEDERLKDFNKFLDERRKGAQESREMDFQDAERESENWEKFLAERREGENESREMDFQQIQRWKDLADPAAKYREEIEDIKFSMTEMGGVSKEVGEANIKLLEDQIAKTNDVAVEMSAVWKTFADNTQRTLADVLYKGFNGTFNDIGEMFKQMLLRMAAEAAAAKIMLSLFGAGGGGGILGALLGGGKTLATSGAIMPAANGAWFDGGVSRFAMGGVVNSPTPFRFASGGSFRNGLMGEAGPEAIMPLKRDSSGRLGVSGGGGKSVYVTNNFTISGATDTRSQAQIAVAAGRGVSRIMRRDG